MCCSPDIWLPKSCSRGLLWPVLHCSYIILISMINLFLNYLWLLMFSLYPTNSFHLHICGSLAFAAQCSRCHQYGAWRRDQAWRSSVSSGRRGGSVWRCIQGRFGGLFIMNTKTFECKTYLIFVQFLFLLSNNFCSFCKVL